MQTKVSIVVINWNSLDNIVECLGSLRKIDYPNYEIIVVDNASTDGSPDRIQNLFPEVILIRNKENLGCGGGNNVGMKYALNDRAKYVWLLNSDTIVEPNALTKLVSTAERLPHAGFLSPVLYYYSTPSKVQHCGSSFDRRNYSIKHLESINDIKRIEDQNFWIWATALLIKREVIDTIGYFNEKYFVYCEDMEYSLMALRAGYTHRIELSARVYHKNHFSDFGGEKKMPLHYFYYTTRNEYWVWMKNTTGFGKVIFLSKYLARVMRKVARYKKDSCNEIADVCLDGLYCAFCNIGGKWNRSVKMPPIIKKRILSHPYFWADLLECNFRKTIAAIFKKVKVRISQGNKIA